MRKTNAFRRFKGFRNQAPPWEMWLLLFLLATIVGLSINGPKPLQSLSSATNYSRFEHDPYDIRADYRDDARDHRLETGL